MLFRRIWKKYFVKNSWSLLNYYFIPSYPSSSKFVRSIWKERTFNKRKLKSHTNACQYSATLCFVVSKAIMDFRWENMPHTTHLLDWTTSHLHFLLSIHLFLSGQTLSLFSMFKMSLTTLLHRTLRYFINIYFYMSCPSERRRSWSTISPCPL